MSFTGRKLAENEQMDILFMLMKRFWPQGVLCPRAKFMYILLVILRSRPMILKLDKKHQGKQLYKLYINYDPGMTLTYFTTRST